jgi:glycosyltransferase involved in cell wall biosynthesis
MTVRIVNVITRMIVGGPQQVSLLTARYYRGWPAVDYHLVFGRESGAEGDYHAEPRGGGAARRARAPGNPRRRGHPRRAPVVSLVQRLSPRKTRHVFVRALPGILAERPDAVAWIAGDGPLRPAVEAAVAEAGVGGRGRFLGLRKDIPAELSAWDVLKRVPAANAPAFVERLRTQAVDLLVSLACPQILRRDVLSVPPRGAINLHGALLPDYRGLLPAF